MNQRKFISEFQGCCTVLKSIKIINILFSLSIFQKVFLRLNETFCSVIVFDLSFSEAFNSVVLQIYFCVTFFKVYLCTFCSLKNLHPCPEENFEHLFFSCNTTDDYLRRFEREFLPDFNFPDIASRKTFWFLCILPDDKEYDIFLATVIWTFKFVIWERKLKKRLPSFLTLKVEFFIIMIGILSVSSFLRNHKNNAVHFICRNWDNIRV